MTPAEEVEAKRIQLESELQKAIRGFSLVTGFIPIAIDYSIIDASTKDSANTMPRIRVSNGLIKST